LLRTGFRGNSDRSCIFLHGNRGLAVPQAYRSKAAGLVKMVFSWGEAVLFTVCTANMAPVLVYAARMGQARAREDNQ